MKKVYAKLKTNEKDIITPLIKLLKINTKRYLINICVCSVKDFIHVPFPNNEISYALSSVIKRPRYCTITTHSRLL